MFEFIAGAKAKLVAALVAVVAFFVSILVIRHKAKVEGAAEVEKVATEKALERVLKAEDIAGEIDKMTEEKIDAELKKWMRPDSDK